MNGLEVLPSWYWCCHSTLAAEDILEAKLQQYAHGFCLNSHWLKLELTIQLDDYITRSNRGNEAIPHAGGDEAGPRQEQLYRVTGVREFEWGYGELCLKLVTNSGWESHLFWKVLAWMIWRHYEEVLPWFLHHQTCSIFMSAKWLIFSHSSLHFVNNSCSELQIHRERERESGEVQASRKVTEEDIFCTQVFIRYDLSMSFS